MFLARQVNAGRVFVCIANACARECDMRDESTETVGKTRQRQTCHHFLLPPEASFIVSLVGVTNYGVKKCTASMLDANMRFFCRHPCGLWPKKIEVCNCGISRPTKT